MTVGRRSLVLGAVAALLIAGVLAVWAPQARAHASLKTSDPAANASLTTSPSQILLTFTEPPDPSLSIVKVVDASGKPAPGVGAARPVAGQSDQLSVPVRTPLPKGVYTVNWRSVSAVDGHVEVGAFAFGVGAKPKAGSVVTVDLQNSSPGLSAAAAAGRWLLYIGLALLVGAASTLLLVYRATAAARRAHTPARGGRRRGARPCRHGRHRAHDRGRGLAAALVRDSRGPVPGGARPGARLLRHGRRRRRPLSGPPLADRRRRHGGAGRASSTSLPDMPTPPRCYSPSMSSHSGST